MRKLSRTLTVSALAVPMVVGAAGVALAAPGGDLLGQATNQGVGQGQGSLIDQGNTNTAPVTQVNPAVNAHDVAGLAGFFNHSSAGQGIDQDNSVWSSNDQTNTARSAQGQSADQYADGGDQDAGSHQSGSTLTESSDQGAVQRQRSAISQGNNSFAPVSQANPAVNLSDVGGLGGAFNSSDADQSVWQDNSVRSRNTQDNGARSAQDQDADQYAQGGDQDS